MAETQQINMLEEVNRITPPDDNPVKLINGTQMVTFGLIKVLLFAFLVLYGLYGIGNLVIIGGDYYTSRTVVTMMKEATNPDITKILETSKLGGDLALERLAEQTGSLLSLISGTLLAITGYFVGARTEGRKQEENN